MNLVAAGAVLALVVRLFVPVNSLLMSSRPRGTFSFDGKGAAAAKAGSPLRALMAKEARLLVATPIYFMNACIGYVLVLVAAIAVAAGTLTGALSLDLLPPELVRRRRARASVGPGVLLQHLVHYGRVGVARGFFALAHADGARVPLRPSCGRKRR